MKPRLTIRPEISHRRHDHREKRRQQFLQVVADEEIFLARLSDDGGGIDRVAAMKDSVDVKDGVIMTQRVVTVVIAKGPFGPSFVWWSVSDQGELSFRGQAVQRGAEWIPRHFEFFPAEQRGEHEFGHVFRQRRNRRQDQRGWSTEKHSYRKRPAKALGLVVMKATALLNLPMQSRRTCIVDLHSVDAEIVLLRDRIFSVDQRQGDKRTTILLPCSEHGKLVESCRTIDNLSHWSARRVSGAEFKKISRDGTVFPELGDIRRQNRLRDLHQFSHDRFRRRSKRDVDTPLGAEHVGNHRITAAFDARKQQRRPAFGNYTTVDLSKLEVWIDLGFDSDDFVFSGETIEKCAKAGMHS